MPSTGNTPRCEWCGQSHTAKCPLIKAVEYHENGTIKRIEFLTQDAADGSKRFPKDVKEALEGGYEINWPKAK
jgi:hypothetical protein